MSQVIVIKNSLKIVNNLCDILEKRDVTVIKAGTDNSKPDFLGIDLVSALSPSIISFSLSIIDFSWEDLLDNLSTTFILKSVKYLNLYYYTCHNNDIPRNKSTLNLINYSIYI